MTHIAQWQTTDISIVNEYFVCIDFHTAQICVFQKHVTVLLSQ